MTRLFRHLAAVACAALLSTPALAADIPHLATQGMTKQLIVDGKPFLILGRTGQFHSLQPRLSQYQMANP